MIRCCICSGQHHALHCATALRYMHECLSGTPDDHVVVAPAPNAWSLDVYREEQRLRENLAQRQRSARRRQLKGLRA